MVEAKVEAKTAPTPRKAMRGTVRKQADSEPKFAVIATGGKQYRVKVGDTVKIEKLPGDHTDGDKITFDQVLLTDNGAEAVTLGTPFINGAEVVGTLNKIARNKTVDVIKYKQKSRYFKKYGHRQPYFEVRIDSIK